MSPTELVTAAQESIAVTVVIPENRGYQVIHRLQMGRHGTEFGNEFRYRTGPLDLARREAARSRGWTATTSRSTSCRSPQGLGARGIRANTAAEVRAALDETRGHQGPVVIVVPVIPHIDLPGAGRVVGRRALRGVGGRDRPAPAHRVRGRAVQAALARLIPLPFLPRKEIPIMTETREIGVGLISVGWMGKLHTRAYQAMPSVYPELGLKCRLVIAADTAPDRVEYAKDVLGYERGTTDYREVLADPDVDVVSICAPNMLHREIGIAAAKAGKPFWIEKPVGRDARETAEVAAAAREAGVATSIGYNYRHAPAIERMRELIADGTLGRITNIRSVFLNGYASEPKGALSWRFQKEFSGSGAMGDLLSHVADLVQYVVGPIEEVTALSTIIHAERPDPADGLGHPLRRDRGRRDGPRGERGLRRRARPLRGELPRRRRGRHPGVLPGRRRAAVRAVHRGLRHRGLGHLELRADERAQARRRPRRRERRLHHRPRQPGHGRLRQVPARPGQQHGLRRPQGHRGQEVPAVGHPGRRRRLHHRRRAVRGRGRVRGRPVGRDRVVGEGARRSRAPPTAASRPRAGAGR